MPPPRPSKHSSFDALLTRLCRITTSGDYIAVIDGYRFIAIAWVVIFHVNSLLVPDKSVEATLGLADSALYGFLRAGAYGVQLFFVISGFLLALPFAKHHAGMGPDVELRKYFMRRLTRLEPPYLICLLLLYIHMALKQEHFFQDLFPHFLAGLFYCHGLIFMEPNPINPVFWSLEVEVQFYILLPLFAYIFRLAARPRRLLIALFMLFSSFLRIRCHLSSLNLLGQVPYFLAGLLLADLYINMPAGKHKTGTAWDLAGGALFVLLPAVCLHESLRLVLLPWHCLFLYYATFRSEYLGRMLSVRVLTAIGGMCYSIYLLHLPLLASLMFRTPDVQGYDKNVVVQILLTAPVVLLFSTAYFLLIEKPCMRRDWPRQLYRKLTGRTQSV